MRTVEGRNKRLWGRISRERKEKQSKGDGGCWLSHADMVRKYSRWVKPSWVMTWSITPGHVQLEMSGGHTGALTLEMKIKLGAVLKESTQAQLTTVTSHRALQVAS